MDTRRLVKVFLASPGDLSAERQTAKAVVDEFNALLADTFGYQIELVGWEDTVSVFGRPQATINRELERCELFIGLVWKRWGTPPDTGGTYASGFEEEFETSVDRRSREGRPEISLFFKDIDEELVRDPGDQLQKVLTFKQNLIDSKTILFEHFSTKTFETKLRRCLVSYVTNLYRREQTGNAEPGRAPRIAEEHPQPSQATGQPTSSPFSPEGEQFLRSLLSSATTPAQGTDEALSVARFRLLGTLVGVHGNDEPVLGVHDANLLHFEQRSNDLRFGDAELRGLLSCGLQHFAAEVVPIWYWLAKLSGLDRQLLSFYTRPEQTTRIRIGAIRAMTLLDDRLPLLDDRKTIVESWLSEGESTLKTAALSYLARAGVVDDIVALRSEIDKADHQTLQAAIDAVLQIALRDSRKKAIAALMELQPVTVSLDVLNGIFPRDSTIDIDTVSEGVKHICADVRRRCSTILRSRDALPLELAEQLKADSDVGVRYEALSSLVKYGRQFSPDEAKAVLISQPQKGVMAGLFQTRSSNDYYFHKFQEDRIKDKTDQELDEMSQSESVFDRDASFVREERHFGRLGDEVRSSVDDNYKADFERKLRPYEERFGGQGDLLAKIRELEDYLRKGFTRRGLDILVRRSDAKDLERVRAGIRNKDVDQANDDIDYLRKFGEWDDIGLILENQNKPSGANSTLLLPGRQSIRVRVSARAIYNLGKARFNEVVRLEMPPKLLIYVLIESTDTSFRDLTDEVIIGILRSNDGDVRKCSALKCIASLPKRRLARLYESYMTAERPRYYNVVHWLDLGVSIARTRGAAAAKRLLRGWS